MAQEAFDLAEQLPDAGVRDAGSRPRHEQLDVRRRSSIRRSRSTAASCSRRRCWRSSASGAATRTSTATASRTARCRATACPPTSRAARATTRRGSTASGRTTTSRTWTGCRASSRRRARTCRSRSSNSVAGAKIGFIGYGTSHWAITESRDQLREETDVKTSYFRLRAYPFTRELAAFIDAHERVYVIEQNRDAQLLQLMRLELTPERISEAAQRAALQRPADRRPQRHRRRAGAGRLRGGEEDRGEGQRRVSGRRVDHFNCKFTDCKLD